MAKPDVVAELLDLENDLRAALPAQDAFSRAGLQFVLRGIENLKQRSAIANRHQPKDLRARQ